jgi:hypothetical protein
MLLADTSGSGSGSSGDPADNLAQVMCLCSLYIDFIVHIICIFITWLYASQRVLL